jgi:hypothetical protein
MLAGFGELAPPRRRPAVCGLQKDLAYRLGRLYGTLEAWPKAEAWEMLEKNSSTPAIRLQRAAVTLRRFAEPYDAPHNLTTPRTALRRLVITLRRLP